MHGTDKRVKSVCKNLTSLILSNLAGASHEQYFPQSDADRMDETIKQGKERAAVLREIREQFENLVTGVL